MISSLQRVEGREPAAAGLLIFAFEPDVDRNIIQGIKRILSHYHDHQDRRVLQRAGLFLGPPLVTLAGLLAKLLK